MDLDRDFFDEMSHSDLPINYISIGESVATDFLEHHGIKGQKWGVRHGPPYPLTPEQKSKSYSRDSGLGGILFDMAGQAALEGINKGIAGSRYKKDDERRASNTNIDKTTGFRLKDKEYSDAEDMKLVNPGYANGAFISDATTTNNCAYCTMAYEIRKRGYDVRAKKAADGTGLTAEQQNACWKYKTEPKHFEVSREERMTLSGKQLESTAKSRKETYDKIVDWVSKQSDQRGNFAIGWGYAGHSMVYEIKNGKFSIRDCQTNTYYKDGFKQLKTLFSVGVGLNGGQHTVSRVDFRRTDDAIPDWKKIKEYVE